MISNKQITVTLVSVSRWLVLAVAGTFVAAIGLLLSAFALALIPLDVVPQALGLQKTMGWQFAWSFSIATSSIPMVFSFAVPKLRKRYGWSASVLAAYVFFWGMRLGDALLDTMNMSVVFGYSSKPSFAFFDRGLFINVVAAMMFVLSNATDELKSLVITSLTAYASYADEVLKSVSHGRSSGGEKGRRDREKRLRTLDSMAYR